MVCINYICDNLQANHLIHFGIGNGKTLICSALAILIALQTKLSLIIIGKNEHVMQRDFTKFQQVINAMALNSNFNFIARSAGIYFFTQPQLKKKMKTPKFISVWRDSIVLVDEYDWILFDGSSDNIVNQLNFYKQAKSIIGFSGSHLTQTEETCLNLSLQSTPVVFPTLDKLQGDKKTQLPDLLVSSNQADYLQKIKEPIKDQVANSPVLIVASDNYNAIQSGLWKSSFNFKSFIEGRYLMKNASKNMAQGRGTDVQTNDEINSNGGYYLIIADVFSRRSEELIIDRIGILNTKGRWQRILYKNASNHSAEQLLIVVQKEIDLILDRKHNQVQSILQNQQEAMENFVEQDQVPQEQVSTEDAKKEERDKQVKDVVEYIVALTEKAYREASNAAPVVKQNNFEEQKEPQQNLEQAEQSKLGFYQPSLIKLIEEKISQNPLLQDKPFDQVQQLVHKKLKRQYHEINKAQSSERDPEVKGVEKVIIRDKRKVNKSLNLSKDKIRLENLILIAVLEINHSLALKQSYQRVKRQQKDCQRQPLVRDDTLKATQFIKIQKENQDQEYEIYLNFLKQFTIFKILLLIAY